MSDTSDFNGASEEDRYNSGDDRRTETLSASSDVHVLDPALEAVARLRRDLQKAKPFPDGTLIAFTSTGNDGQHYHYGAVFAAGEWWFTGQGNSYFPKKCTHQQLTDLLVARGHTIFGLKVATKFESIEL